MNSGFLTDDDLAFFAAFGFLTLDPGVCAEQITALERECAQALADAYGGLPRARQLAESAHCYLPMMGPSTPVSAALAEADILVDAARRVLGK